MSEILYAGIDVSSTELRVAFLNDKAQELRPQSSFPNTPDGWKALATALVSTATLCGPDSTILCGLEATGDHHLGLLRTLQAERRRPIQIHELNPYSLRHFAKALLTSAKTDRLDAYNIALYLLRLKPSPLINHRSTSSASGSLLASALKNRLHHILRLYLPGYQEIAGGKLPAGLLACLARFPSPHLLLQAGEIGLQEIRIGPKHRPRPAHIKKLLSIAQNAPLQKLSTPEQLIIQHLASQILQQNQLISVIDREIENFLQHHFPHQTLTSIPGIGPLTAAVILAEVGDIQRFPSVKHFIGYCGLYPTVYQSGKVEFRARMTHKGNRMLKMAFLLASASARQHNPQISVYYERLRKKGKSKKACGGAIARKLAEITYALLMKGETWDAEKAQEGIFMGQRMAGEIFEEGAAWPTSSCGKKPHRSFPCHRGSRPLDKSSSGSSGYPQIITHHKKMFPCHNS